MPDRVYGGRTAADRRAERRQRLLDAGLELFGTEGYVATSIERLCSAAGVSTRNFYEEFTGREALLTALHDMVLERALKAVADAFARAENEPLALRIELAVRAYIATTAEDRRWARLSYVEIVGVSETVERHRLAWRERWVAFLVAEARRAVEHGEAMSRDFHLSAVALIGAVNELVYHWAVGDHRIPLDDVIAEIVRIATVTLTGP
ncbi:TetR/AcrR family transcriptional regulator [Prauserella sp. PE36]|uniref:TetR/AcrR family transcriptional regulator n=1 Tax=Prauserella sp. PE36 TaxID=1504709 RepID=UPI000D836BEE|nr:TetR/AcrR family transcriptional regulator [Prauserella sp. PE36]PXY23769.1 transcriptional regulator [Prauserella coralliicola]RBM13345.1 TetR/AcrR family transcriptional regulator [Prauserella sp. PE36]